MIFETHSHYDDESFDEDRATLLDSMKSKGVGTIINVGASFAGCKASLEYAENYDFIFAAIGIHPENTEDFTGDNIEWLQKHITDERVVAVGEIGLDYHWEKTDEGRKLQHRVFKEQLKLAAKHELPVIVHSREACEDTFEILEAAANHGVTGVMHCFSYPKEIARRYVKMGFYVGVGGVVTFKNSKKLKEVVAAVPLDRILLETDCPYMAPEPFRGKRNDSSMIKYVAEEIAGIREISYEEVVEATEANAKRLFLNIK